MKDQTNTNSANMKLPISLMYKVIHTYHNLTYTPAFTTTCKLHEACVSHMWRVPATCAPLVATEANQAEEQ